MASIPEPSLNIKDIPDIYLRRNFENLREYFAQENQLLGFNFFEFIFTEAKANFTFNHGLTTIPQDIVVTHITGSGTVQFNNGLFTLTQCDLTATGPIRIRFFIGTYWNYQGNTNYKPTDVMQFSPRIAT